MKTALKIALGIVLGGLVLIVACSALIAGGIEEAEDERQERGITLTEFRAVDAGTSEREVRRTFGRPEDAQEFEQHIPELEAGTQRSSCIYYPEKGKPLFEGRSFQLCFDEGRLTSKNAY